MENEKNIEDLSLDDSKEESIEEAKDNNEEQVNKDEKPPKQISLVKNGLFNTFYQILAILTPLITTPYISRILGSAGIGVYSFTHSLVTYFMLIAGLVHYPMVLEKLQEEGKIKRIILRPSLKLSF